MNEERQISWQEQQLRRFMAEHADDPLGEHLSVKLSNPEEESEIDEMILQELWPGVVQALHGSRLTTWTGGNNNPRERDRDASPRTHHAVPHVRHRGPGTPDHAAGEQAVVLPVRH